MPTAKVLDLTSKEVGEIELPETVFGVPLNEPLIHEAVRSFLANRRAGTSATKTRGDVSGSGRKLWKEKGTGRNRGTGPTICRRRCASALCVRRFRSGCVKAIW